jgi:adenosine deaminase
MDSEKFKEFLVKGSLAGLVTIPKSDLHNHASNGGNIDYLAKLAGIEAPIRPSTFPSVLAMEEWAHATIKKHCDGLMRIEAAFVQARNDNITVMGFSCVQSAILRSLGSCSNFIDFLKGHKKKYTPNALYLPEIQVFAASDSETIEKDCSLLDEIYSHNYFKAIDLLFYDENTKPTRNYKDFKKMCRLAKEAGLKLKAHVGEWGTADDVMAAVEELALDQVQHGIAAASSPQIMKWLAKHKIQLNVCPTCNIMLERVESYKMHPIRVLYDYGVPVTINSDDMMICNQSVSQEYLNLYNCGLMNENELDDIRLTGLANL